MATVYFYNFSKRRNSTKIPSGSGTSHTVRLKDATSLYRPVFELSGGNYPTYTYASWQGYYYYVTDIVSTANNLYEVECELDPMGSARSDILNTTAFVNRSASSYDLWMPDNELSNKAKIVSHGHKVSSLSGIFDSTGCYIMRVIGKEGIDTFILDKSDLHDILDFMFDDGNFTDVLGDAVIKAVFNPFQYVVSLQYTPLSYTWVSDGAFASTFHFGWWPVNTDTYKKTSRTGLHVLGQTVTLPDAYFNDFRDYDTRFTRCNMILPGGIETEIPSSWLSLGSLKIEIVFDILTGKAMYLITDSGSNVMSTFSAQLGFDVQIGQQAVSAGGIISNAVSAGVGLGSFMSGNALGALAGIGGLSGAVSAITQPNPSIVGSQQTALFAQVQSQVEIEYTRYESGTYADATIGRMLNQQVTLSTLTGFTKCSNASVNTELPAQYKDEINNYLNSGFFIE